MSKQEGTAILNAIKENIKTYKVKKKDAESFYDIADEIIAKAIDMTKPYTVLYRFPYVIVILDSKKNKELFEKFSQINLRLVETFANEDLEDIILKFIADRKKAKISTTDYSGLLKILNQVPLFNLTTVAFISGVSFKNDEILGNFKFRRIHYNNIEKIYGRSLYKSIIDKSIEDDKFRKKDFYFLEYHNSKIRIRKDKSITSSNHHISKISEIFKKKIQILSFVFSFLNGIVFDDNGKKRNNSKLEIYNIFHHTENAIYLFEDLEDNLTNSKGGQILSLGQMPIQLRRDRYGNGIIKDEIDEGIISLVDKKKQGLENNIFQAVLWTGKSIQNDDLEEAFVQLFIALEALVCSSSISDFVAYYLGDKLDQRLSYKTLIKDMHNKRSRIVHQNSFSNTVDYIDYIKLLKVVKDIVYKMYSQLSTVKNKEDLEKQIENIKYS